MTPKFEIDENVIITDFVDDEYVYITDFVEQIIINRYGIEYIFKNVSRPVSHKRVFAYTFEKEKELLNKGYKKVYNLI